MQLFVQPILLGTQLKDLSGKDLGDYYARLVSYYTQGGFVDEAGI